MWKQIMFLMVFGLLSFAAAASVGAASGMGPGDAIAPNNGVKTVTANSAQWYAFELGGKRAKVAVTLDAASEDGLRLQIYTPAQIATYLNGEKLHAIGVGSLQGAHALAWYGEFHQAGTYYAIVSNDTGASVSVTVGVESNALVSQAVMTVPAKIEDPLQKSVPVSTKGIGGKIAFVDATGGNVYTVSGDGTNLQRVSFGMDPQWNHAGTSIALARQGPVAGIFTIDPNGGNERLLYGISEPRAPDWNAANSQIVFSYQGATKGGGTVTFGKRTIELPSRTEWKLGLVNVSDGSYHEVLAGSNAATPTWKPDGIIAYNDSTIGLMTTTASGEPSENPFIGDLRATSESYNPLAIRSPQYSPDGSKIVYMVQQSPTWQIAIANADGTDQHLLTSDNVLSFTHPDNVAPVWSSDGSKILFLSNRNGKWEFFTMSPDGSNVEQVLKNVTDQVTITYSYQAARMMSWME